MYVYDAMRAYFTSWSMRHDDGSSAELGSVHTLAARNGIEEIDNYLMLNSKVLHILLSLVFMG